MRKTAMLCAIFATSVSASNFPLGLSYSSWLGGGSFEGSVGVDSIGAVYSLVLAEPGELVPTFDFGSSSLYSAYIIKVSADGAKLVYVARIGLYATSMAVDSGGSVYVVAGTQVVKLDASGSRIDYKIQICADCGISAIAVDGAGHAYVTGGTGLAGLATTPGAFQTSVNQNPGHAFVVKVNADGTGLEYATYLAGSGSEGGYAIAVNAAGEVFITGATMSQDFPITAGAYRTAPSGSRSASAGFLTRLSANGASLVYSTFTTGVSSDSVAIAPPNDAVLYFRTALGMRVMRFNANGTALQFSRDFPGGEAGQGSLAVDADGNTYVTGSTEAANFSVYKSIFACGSASVYEIALDSAGNILQSTYVAPSSTGESGASVAVAPNGDVVIEAPAGAGFVPTRLIVGLAEGGPLLARLSHSATFTPVSLACVGNSGSLLAGPVAPGEIVSLFGRGLGPQQGITPTVALDSRFPAQLGDTVVTFDGIATPILYAQDAQVNAVAPWRLAAGSTTRICVLYQGVSTNCISQKVEAAAPGVFTSDGVYAAAINQDGTINSAENPAPIGSIVAVFATGLGLVSPLPADGSIALLPLGVNTLPVKGGSILRYNGSSFVEWTDPQYAGPAPFEISGVSQINLTALSGQLVLSLGADVFNPLTRDAQFQIHIKNAQ